jgi:hypothetical protein
MLLPGLLCRHRQKTWKSYSVKRPPVAVSRRSTEVETPGTPGRCAIASRGAEGREDFRRARAATLRTRNLYRTLGTQCQPFKRRPTCFATILKNGHRFFLDHWKTYTRALN